MGGVKRAPRHVVSSHNDWRTQMIKKVLGALASTVVALVSLAPSASAQAAAAPNYRRTPGSRRYRAIYCPHLVPLRPPRRAPLANTLA